LNPWLAEIENDNRIIKGKRWLTGKAIKEIEKRRKNKLKDRGVEDPRPDQYRLDLTG
jgi:hypothetical protein